MTPPDSRADATIQDVATHYGVSERTVRNWMKEYGLPHRRIGPQTVRFNMDEVEEWASAGSMTETENDDD